jgi:hypothetical protein
MFAGLFIKVFLLKKAVAAIANAGLIFRQLKLVKLKIGYSNKLPDYKDNFYLIA